MMRNGTYKYGAKLSELRYVSIRMPIMDIYNSLVSARNHHATNIHS